MDELFDVTRAELESLDASAVIESPTFLVLIREVLLENA